MLEGVFLEKGTELSSALVDTEKPESKASCRPCFPNIFKSIALLACDTASHMFILIGSFKSVND